MNCSNTGTPAQHTGGPSGSCGPARLGALAALLDVSQSGPVSGERAARAREHLYGLIDLFASEYGWTMHQILELCLDDVPPLIRQIKVRRGRAIRLRLGEALYPLLPPELRTEMWGKVEAMAGGGLDADGARPGPRQEPTSESQG